PTPGEPYRLMSYFVFLTVIGAGILLGLNWKKLGKPEWQGKTIFISIFLPVIMIVLAIGWVMLLMPRPDLPMPFVLSIPMLAFGVNFGFLLALARLQNGAYKKFKQEGFGALQGYEYDIDGALFFGAIVTLGFVIFGVFIVPLL
ncbi:MAG TPA: hypothetical protein VN843_18420, partial [Anaerolineales bacterium]|nr:hypothetical protein [Anaerolineales bacterium]